MNKTENADGKPLLDKVKEIGRQYGVEVTNGADRGIRAIGILGGISGKYNEETEQGVKKGNNSEALARNLPSMRRGENLEN